MIFLSIKKERKGSIQANAIKMNASEAKECENKRSHRGVRFLQQGIHKWLWYKGCAFAFTMCIEDVINRDNEDQSTKWNLPWKPVPLAITGISNNGMVRSFVVTLTCERGFRF